MKKLTLVAAVLILVAILWGGYFLTDVFFQNSRADSVAQNFTIKLGEGVNQISDNLFAAGLIDSKFNFETYIWLLRRENKIQAGDYLLSGSMSLREVVNILTYGFATNEKKVTIIEGWTNVQIGDYLIENLFTYLGPKATRDDYLKSWQSAIIKDYDYNFLSAKPDTVDIEGYLFPDTYNFYTDVEPQEIVTTLLDNFAAKLSNDLLSRIKQQKRTLHEVVTMSSILEKEVRTESDRRLVADILWRRLGIGMPLQADSTVNYITGKKVAAISAEDKKVNSPYNTYQNKGLPPGPICNPGLVAIKAAAEPTANDYWYFLTTPEGEVIYSKTLDEHNAAKAKYLK